MRRKEDPTKAAELAEQEEPDVDSCQEEGICPDKCDECGKACEDMTSEACKTCIISEGCKECAICEMKRLGKPVELLHALLERKNEQAPKTEDSPIDKDAPAEDPCDEDKICSDECDECG